MSSKNISNISDLKTSSPPSVLKHEPMKGVFTSQNVLSRDYETRLSA